MYKEGYDPNRNYEGRPKGAKNFTTKVREALEAIADGHNISLEEELIKSILHKAIVEKDMLAAKLIWNYLDGMPIQKMQADLNIAQMQEVRDKLDKIANNDTNPTSSGTVL